MRIRIEELKGGKLSLEFEEAPETFPVLTEMVATGVCEFLAPVKTALSAQQIGDMVEIEGSISTAVRLSCGRCLQSFETPVESSFALTYKQTEPDTDKGSSNQEELELTMDGKLFSILELYHGEQQTTCLGNSAPSGKIPVKGADRL